MWIEKIDYERFDERVYLPDQNWNFNFSKELISKLNSSEQVRISNLWIKIRELILLSKKITSKKDLIKVWNREEFKLNREKYELKNSIFCRKFLFLLEEKDKKYWLEYIRLYRKSEKLLKKNREEVRNGIKKKVIRLL